MDPQELLQTLGLNKYEADAYYTLLAEGPLTGYELGKRSGVPLSRSYEILERLHARGLALRQPGDPPRYAAQDHRVFLAGVRADLDQTLGALTTALAAVARPTPEHDFWVLRGRRPILDRLRSSIEAARRSVDLLAPLAHAPALADVLDAAPDGRRVFTPGGDQSEVVLLLADGTTALAGMLDPPAHCQAVLGGNPALVTLLQRYFATAAAFAPPALPPAEPQDDWVAWETHKQRRLWRLAGHPRSA